MRGYIHPEHGLLFISDGISSGQAWGTFYRHKTGALRRLKSPSLPVRETREEAQRDLDEYAKAKRLPVAGGGEQDA